MLKLNEYIKLNKKDDKVNAKFGFFGEQYRNVGAFKYDVFTVSGTKKAFAFIAYPFSDKPKGGYPAVLLIHGGNGNAFYETARWWADKGYVAIAPDFDGSYAKSINERRERNDSFGPRGYGSFTDMESDNPWAYFSVLSAMKAIDFLLADKNVNKDKICSVGLSWGGFINLLLASVDKRIKCASVIYSSAFISDSEWGMHPDRLGGLSAEQIKKYNEYIDPRAYLKNITCPVFFTAGTDDIAFEMENRRKTAQRISAPTYFGLRYSFPHGNFYGFDQPECIRFSDLVLNNKKVPCPTLYNYKKFVKIKAKKGVKNQVYYTKDNLDTTHKPKWQKGRLVGGKFNIGHKVCAYFITEEDKLGNRWSSDLIRIK